LPPRRESGIQPPAQTCAVSSSIVETTGLDSRRDRIIELGMSRIEVDPQTGRAVRVVDEYQGLEDPGVPIDARPHVSPASQMDGSRKRLDEHRIAEIAQGAALAVAHNARFDRQFVEARIELFARLPWACSCFEIDWAAEDRSSAKLSSLAMENGWFFDGHRALEDCHAVLAVLDAPLLYPAAPGSHACWRRRVKQFPSARDRRSL